MTLGRPATGLPRYYMDVDWHRSPKWAGVSAEALAVHPIAVGYCTKHATDGQLPADLEDLSLALGIRVSVLRKALKDLVDGRRWTHDGDGLVIIGYEDHNPIAAEVAEHAERQRSRGALGNHRRWHERRGIVDPECAYCESPGESPGDGRQATSPQGDRQGTASPGESLGMGWDGMGNPPTSSDNSHSGDTEPDGGGDYDVVGQAVQLAAERYVAHKAERERVDSPDGMAKWWLQQNGHGARIRARKVLDDHDLTALQLADVVMSPTDPSWLSAYRRRPADGPVEQPELKIVRSITTAARDALAHPLARTSPDPQETDHG